MKGEIGNGGPETRKTRLSVAKADAGNEKAQTEKHNEGSQGTGRGAHWPQPSKVCDGASETQDLTANSGTLVKNRQELNYVVYNEEFHINVIQRIDHAEVLCVTSEEEGHTNRE